MSPDGGTLVGLQRAAWVALLVGVTAIFLVPLLWVVVGSLRSPDLPPPRAIAWWPDPASTVAWERLAALVPLARYAGSSVLVVAIAVPMSLLTASMAGFAIAQLPGPTRRAVVIGALVLLLIPASALWLTRFLLYHAAGVIDTPVPLVATAVMGGSPLFVLLYVWAFRRIPQELVDAARLEGAGPVRAWWGVGLPLVVPTTVAVGTLAFLASWGDYVSPTLYLRSDDWATLTLGLRRLQTLDRGDWPVLLAGAVLLALPAVLVFAVAQRRFLRDDSLADVLGGGG